MSLLAEPSVRVRVVVTFLRMDAPPRDPPLPFPPGAEVVHPEPSCSVVHYRQLYDAVGADYVWWLRRGMPDNKLGALLRDPRITIAVLRKDGVEAGFYELDRASWPVVNLSYFGLMPHAIGQGLGRAFLRHAIDAVWAMRPGAMTVNTCTADHPRALPTYLRAGFRILRQVPEEWRVPIRLGLDVPERLRVG